MQDLERTDGFHRKIIVLRKVLGCTRIREGRDGLHREIMKVLLGYTGEGEGRDG